MAKDCAEESQEFTPRTLMTQIGNWKLRETLGRGAYAHVRRAIHVSGHIAACKILPALHGHHNRPFTEDERIDAVEAHKELVLLKGLAGAGIPGIVGLEGVIPYKGWNFIFLTVYPHSANVITGHTAHVVPFFRKLLHAVWALHMLDLSHEDLKRSNILASHELEPVLVDFGFAHFIPNGGKAKSLGGTMDYSSPEKLAGFRYDPYANDVWSLGIILVKLFDCRNPYRVSKQETDEQFKERLISREPNWDFLGECDEPGQLGEVIRGMLDRDPKTRWDINRILAHPAMQVATPEPPMPWIPNCDLPRHVHVTEDIVLDIAFLSYNLKQFQLCESLDIIVADIFHPEPNWQKRWANMLSMWKQREETLWEDIPEEVQTRTPNAKGVNIAKVSRASLRPLREIVLSPKAAHPAKATRPAPVPPVTPRKIVEDGLAKDPPRRPRKSRDPPQKKDSGSSPVEQKRQHPALATSKINIPTTHRIPTKKERATFVATSPKAPVRQPSARLRYLAEARVEQHRQHARQASSSRTLVPTSSIPQISLLNVTEEPELDIPEQPAAGGSQLRHSQIRTRLAAKASEREKENIKRVKTSQEKENLPPPGERATNALKVPARKDVRPLQPSRRSPRWA